MATDKEQDPIGPNPHERSPQGTGDKDPTQIDVGAQELLFGGLKRALRIEVPGKEPIILTADDLSGRRGRGVGYGIAQWTGPRSGPGINPQLVLQHYEEPTLAILEDELPQDGVHQTADETGEKPALSIRVTFQDMQPELSWKVDPATGRLAPPQITFTAEQLKGDEFDPQVAGADAVINPPTPTDPETL